MSEHLDKIRGLTGGNTEPQKFVAGPSGQTAEDLKKPLLQRRAEAQAKETARLERGGYDYGGFEAWHRFMAKHGRRR